MVLNHERFLGHIFLHIKKIAILVVYYLHETQNAIKIYFFSIFENKIKWTWRHLGFESVIFRKRIRDLHEKDNNPLNIPWKNSSNSFVIPPGRSGGPGR